MWITTAIVNEYPHSRQQPQIVTSNWKCKSMVCRSTDAIMFIACKVCKSGQVNYVRAAWKATIRVAVTVAAHWWASTRIIQIPIIIWPELYRSDHRRAACRTGQECTLASINILIGFCEIWAHRRLSSSTLSNFAAYFVFCTEINRTHFPHMHFYFGVNNIYSFGGFIDFSVLIYLQIGHHQSRRYGRFFNRAIRLENQTVSAIARILCARMSLTNQLPLMAMSMHFKRRFLTLVVKYTYENVCSTLAVHMRPHITALIDDLYM